MIFERCLDPDATDCALLFVCTRLALLGNMHLLQDCCLEVWRHGHVGRLCGIMWLSDHSGRLEHHVVLGDLPTHVVMSFDDG